MNNNNIIITANSTNCHHSQISQSKDLGGEIIAKELQNLCHLVEQRLNLASYAASASCTVAFLCAWSMLQVPALVSVPSTAAFLLAGFSECTI
jgi:hypothetical protein